MGMEDIGQPEAASRLFLQAWNEATNDFEKFTAAYYVARHQATVSDKLQWLETSLRFALKINDVTVNAAFPALENIEPGSGLRFVRFSLVRIDNSCAWRIAQIASLAPIACLLTAHVPERCASIRTTAPVPQAHTGE